jgi:hypothetical protein
MASKDLLVTNEYFFKSCLRLSKRRTRESLWKSRSPCMLLSMLQCRALVQVILAIEGAHHVAGDVAP